MNKLKGILVLSLLLSMVSISARAVELGKYNVPEFSIMIGSRLYTLDYANDKKEELEITKAITENAGGIFVKTTGSDWIDNSTGKVATAIELDKLDVEYFNGVAVVTPPAEEGAIIFKSVDVDTNLQLGDSIYKKGVVGTTCEGYIKVIEGYSFVSADTDFTGKFTSLEQTVTLKYKKNTMVVNNPPSAKVTGLTTGLTITQGDVRYMLVEAVDEDKATTNIRVSLDGVEIGNSNAQCYVLLNTETLGGHIVKINSRDKEGLVGDEQSLTYAVRQAEVK